VSNLVTGAAGLLGGYTVEQLLARGEEVKALVLPGDDAAWLERAGARVHRGDVRDRASLQPALEGVRRVYHCAARTGPWGREADYQAANVAGTINVVEAAIEAGAERIVHVSSITVHGNDVEGVADEASPIKVEPNPYSRTKVAAERAVEELIRRRGAPVAIVRPGWIYGARDRASFGRLVESVRRGRMPIIGSGRNRLPLIHAADAAQGLILAGGAACAAGRAYLLVSGEPVTQRAYLCQIAHELGVPEPRLRLPYRLAVAMGALAEAAGHALRLEQAPPLTRYGVQLLGGDNAFSPERARRELCLAPAVSMVEGVATGVAWYLESRATEPAAEVFAQCQP
jgi:nucleoside-diphosphate-sugar epimerase